MTADSKLASVKQFLKQSLPAIVTKPVPPYETVAVNAPWIKLCGFEQEEVRCLAQCSLTRTDTARRYRHLHQDAQHEAQVPIALHTEEPRP